MSLVVRGDSLVSAPIELTNHWCNRAMMNSPKFPKPIQVHFKML